MGRPTSVKDVDQHDIVNSIATFLKKSGKIKLPEWVDLVKLGKNKELAPINPDWYYVRVASIARRLYIRSPTGFVLLIFQKTKSENRYNSIHLSDYEGPWRGTDTWYNAKTKNMQLGSLTCLLAKKRQETSGTKNGPILPSVPPLI